jgi:hypothetical protein
MKKIILVIGILALFYGVTFHLVPWLERKTFIEKEAVASSLDGTAQLPVEEKPKMVHISPPYPLHGIYFSSWAAGSATFRKRMNELFDTGAINAVVIDIKDATGRLGYVPETQELTDVGSGQKRIADLDAFIQTLHQKGIYVIGRVAVFQDDYLSRKNPQWALLKEGTQKTWVDAHNLGWLDPGAEGVWKYVGDIALESYTHGFDEINFDYIRFPSDGAGKKYTRQFSLDKTLPQALSGFFNYVDANLKGKFPISFDVFGMTTTANDDMGIGQWFEDIIPHGDYIMPMVYPSHYGTGVFGYKNPADHPYEVVKAAMEGAVTRAEALGIPKEKLRSWLQDFDLGATYNAKEVVAQMNASTDAGVPSWVLWDASNQYTKDALLQIAQTVQSDSQTNGNVQ